MDLTIDTETKAGSVSAILNRPADATALLVFAHGAGAGMRHKFMETMSQLLAQRKIATLRYQFPYTEAGRRQPDRPPILEATVQAAVSMARKAAPDLPLLAGGKSMGGRMTSSAAAHLELPGVDGLVFFGFPLHPPGNVGDSRAEHLTRVELPMLFIQGTRDSLADLTLITGVTRRLGQRATLHIVDGGDHSFHVPKRSGRSDADALTEVAETVGTWAAVTLVNRSRSSQPSR
jgi:predicted alpha/beta-hydrolase family hydrolase